MYVHVYAKPKITGSGSQSLQNLVASRLYTSVDAGASLGASLCELAATYVVHSSN